MKNKILRLTAGINETEALIKIYREKNKDCSALISVYNQLLLFKKKAEDHLTSNPAPVYPRHSGNIYDRFPCSRPNAASELNDALINRFTLIF